MTSRGPLVLLALFYLAYTAAGADYTGKYVKANIVETWDACPVKKPTEWDPKVFNPSLDSLTQMSEDKYAGNITKKCQDRLLALADCASDNDPFSGTTVTSLSTVDGCCLKSCADAIQVAIKEGCFDELLKTSLCVDPDAEKYKVGIFNAGVRCANYVKTCPPAGAAPAKAAANATAAATATKANATTADAMTAATDAVAPSAAATAAKAQSGAGAAAATAMMAALGAGAMLLAL